MSDETKGPEPESEQLTPEELAKVAGGANTADGNSGPPYWYCDGNGNPVYGSGWGQSSAYQYDPVTRTCRRV
jgi:hypothetical protein